MKAIVMAGGEGTRLRPLTCRRPKPLVPIVNKPVMEHIIELLKSHHITDIIATTQYLADHIGSYFGDGQNHDVKITYSVEEFPLGTAGSVKKVHQFLDDTFIIISGDALTDFNLTDIIKFHKEKKSLATITLTRVENPLEFGVVITDEEGRIRRFLEKPSWGEVFSDTINTGIYVLEPEVLDLLEPGKVYDFSQDLFPRLLKEGKSIWGYVANSYWCDIGNLQQYRQAHYHVLLGKTNVKIQGEKRGGDIWVGEGTEISPDAEINGPVVIGRHCRIKPFAKVEEFTVIGDNCIIEEGATLHRSIVWNNTYIGNSSRLNNCQIGQQCTIKDHAYISEGAVIGDKCFIGQGSLIQPHVKIWPDKIIEDGATVSMSLIWSVRWPGSLFGTDGINGLGNIEITPEFALKLGAAYGAFLEKNSYIITSRDTHPASRMINRSIIAGLTSVGVNVLDLRNTPSPVSRFATNALGVKGGTHVHIHPNNPNNILIEFFNPKGINIDKSTERKIENIFFREDFRRTSPDEVGTIDFPSRVIEHYTEKFLNFIDTEEIRKSGFKIVIDYAYGNTSLILPNLLGKLGCEMVALNSYIDPNKGREFTVEKAKSLNQLSNIVTTLKTDLGILIDIDGERLILIDETGRIISRELLLALISLLVMRNKSKEGSDIAVPINAPNIIEEIAASYGGRVIRTKSDSRSLMAHAIKDKNLIFAGDTYGGFIFPSFQPNFDAMYAFAKILELMSKESALLSELVDSIPPFFLSKEIVYCSWQQKGTVMRNLIEETEKEKQIETLEGIKIYKPDGWLLIIPDATEPFFHIYSEAKNQEEADKLTRFYKEKIEKMVGKITPKFMSAKIDASLKEKLTKREPPIVLEPERSFYFWNEKSFFNLKASSLKEFYDAICKVDPSSLIFHLKRGDFEKWLEYELFEEDLAKELRNIRKMNLTDHVQIREKLKKALKKAL